VAAKTAAVRRTTGCWAKIGFECGRCGGDRPRTPPAPRVPPLGALKLSDVVEARALLAEARGPPVDQQVGQRQVLLAARACMHARARTPDQREHACMRTPCMGGALHGKWGGLHGCPPWHAVARALLQPHPPHLPAAVALEVRLLGGQVLAAALHLGSMRLGGCARRSHPAPQSASPRRTWQHSGVRVLRCCVCSWPLLGCAPALPDGASSAASSPQEHTLLCCFSNTGEPPVQAGANIVREWSRCAKWLRFLGARSQNEFVRGFGVAPSPVECLSAQCSLP
jgi:hypothetical protein